MPCLTPRHTHSLPRPWALISAGPVTPDPCTAQTFTGHLSQKTEVKERKGEERRKEESGGVEKEGRDGEGAREERGREGRGESRREEERKGKQGKGKEIKGKRRVKQKEALSHCC